MEIARFNLRYPEFSAVDENLILINIEDSKATISKSIFGNLYEELDVEPASYHVWFDKISPQQSAGVIKVYSDSEPGTLNDYLINFSANEATPAVILTISSIKEEALEAANAAKASESVVSQYADNAKASADSAENSKTLSAQSESNAKTSEDNAAASAQTAKTKADESLTSATNATNSANSAALSEGNAKVSENNASLSAKAAKASEDNAKLSENSASTSEANAKSYKDNAKTSADNAKTSEDNALKYKDASKTNADNASASATQVQTDIQNWKDNNSPNQLLSQNGYIEMPPDSNGKRLIMQWGLTKWVAQDSSLSTSFPKPFPNECFSVTVSSNTYRKNAYVNGVAVTSISKTSFTVTHCFEGAYYYWQAIGY